MAVTQRRGRRIMMTPAELDEFLATQRTCRVATVSRRLPARQRAVVRLGRHLAVAVLVTRSRRWADLRKDPRIAVVVDAGEEYGELRGVELSGARRVRRREPAHRRAVPELDAPETLFARKNFGLDEMPHDGRHAWMRLTPDTIASWDFRKLPSV